MAGDLLGKLARERRQRGHWECLKWDWSILGWFRGLPKISEVLTQPFPRFHCSTTPQFRDSAIPSRVINQRKSCHPTASGRVFHIRKKQKEKSETCRAINHPARNFCIFQIGRKRQDAEEKRPRAQEKPQSVKGTKIGRIWTHLDQEELGGMH